LGRHKAAIEVFEECLALDQKDWEVHFFMGLCYKYLRVYEESIRCFNLSKEAHKHDQIYIEMGKVYSAQQDYQAAIQVYLEGLEHSPENPEILTTIGLLYIRMGENFNAF
jgi:Bardet-Biedl syndrome 4 protein